MKITKTKKAHKNHGVLFCIGQLLLSIKPTLECGSCPQCYCVGEDLSFLSQQLLLENIFLVRGEPLSSPHMLRFCLFLHMATVL